MANLGNIGHRKRLRERFMRSGFRGFADHEIVELFLTLCIPRCDVKKQAKELLKKFGSVGGIFDANVEEIMSIKGIGQVAPIAIRIIKSTIELYLQSKVERKPIFENSEKLINFWKSRLRGLSIEVFEVAYLDANLCLLPDGIEELERGTVDRANIYPRKILESALKRQAKGIIIAHNHPSGNALPSDVDELVTGKIKLAAKCLDILLIDHIIISKVDEYSFREFGII